jgi:hypothetical protein
MGRKPTANVTSTKVTPPGELRLVVGDFPAEPWAKRLVEGVNQFSTETVKAIATAATVYKLLSFTTGSVVADSFPIDIPVEAPPLEVRVAQVVSGAPSAGEVPGLLWQPLSGGKTIRVSLISGLQARTAYVIRLGMN